MFRKELPKVCELRDLIEKPDSPNAYFQNLDNRLKVSTEMMQYWLIREKQLQGLDLESWDSLKKEASPYLTIKDDKRGWQQLIDILNQARGYNYLKIIGCSNVSFIPRSPKKGIETPDLQGALDSINILCEVKTINISDKEAIIRSQRPFGLGTTEIILEQGFYIKLMSDIAKAKKQLEAHDASKEARRMVYIIINYDDALGEVKEEYFQQIDQYLSENPVNGIEVVFHNQTTAFHKSITMKSATVFNE